MFKVQNRCLSAVILVALSTTAMPVAVRAQDAKPAVQEPQYIGDFAQANADGSLVALEKEKMTMETKSHNHFVSVSVTGNYVVAGAASTVRVPANATFVVRISPGSEAIDPSTVVQMRPFVVQKGARTLPITTAKAGMFQGVKSATAADTSLSLTFKKYGPNSLLITPSQPLPPGEYALATNNGVQGVFCFGVDAK